MTRIPRFICGLGFGMGLAAAGACQGGNPQDASASSEDGDCAKGTENCVCEDDSDCGPGLVCASRQCTPSGEGSTSTSGVDDETSAGTTSEPGSTDESDGDSTSHAETGNAECDPDQGVANGDCEDPGRPYCSPDGVCVGCVELGGCGTLPDLSPVCDEASGVCVQCTADDVGACDGTTPVCGPMNTCVACTAHESCASGACNFASGECFDQVLYVDRAAVCASGDGSPEAPYCEIQDAVSKAVVDQLTVVKVKTSPGAYAKQIQVGAGRTVAIVRDGNGTVTLNVPDLDPVVVNDTAEAFLYNLRITGGSMSKGLLCLNAAVWLDRVQIDKRDGHAIDAFGCTLTIRRSKLYNNIAGGVKASGGTTRIENSYIVQNGNAFGEVAALSLSNGANLDVLYSTIVDNDAANTLGESLDCEGAGAVSLRNAILFGKSAATSVSCPAVTVKDSVVDAMSLTGTGVVHEADLDPAWFIAPATGNFAIKVDTPFKDNAVWRAGDPAVDYDGDPRLTDDGVMDYSGADRPN